MDDSQVQAALPTENIMVGQYLWRMIATTNHLADYLTHDTIRATSYYPSTSSTFNSSFWQTLVIIINSNLKPSRVEKLYMINHLHKYYSRPYSLFHFSIWFWIQWNLYSCLDCILSMQLPPRIRWYSNKFAHSAKCEDI